MNFFTSVTNWVLGGLRRAFGTQITGPLGYDTPAAASVTFDSAMQLSAVWACVKLLSETVASLPFTVYKGTGAERKVAENHVLTLLFAGKVNRYQTRIEFFETFLLNLIISGNAYALISRTGGSITSLLPLPSSQIRAVLLLDGSLVYEYATDTGVTVLSSESVWHVKLMGNGTVGLSPLAYQRNTVGIALAVEDAVTKIYRNGAKPSGTLTMDKILTPAQREQVRTNFATLTESEDDRLLVLEAGMKFAQISLSPQDIELLASRKYQISEVCRWYGVPSVMINDNNGTSVWGSGIEQVVQGFYKLTVRPILEKIELSFQVHLLSPSERFRYSGEFDLGALERADKKSRYEGYKVGINGGFLTPNEARAEEMLAPQAGGDTLLVQGAMIPIELAGVAHELHGNIPPKQ